MSLLAAPAKTCNRCDQRIEWATHVTTLRSVPCNPEPDPHGLWIVSDGRCASAEPGKRYPGQDRRYAALGPPPNVRWRPRLPHDHGACSATTPEGWPSTPPGKAIRARNIARDQERDAHPWRG